MHLPTALSRAIQLEIETADQTKLAQAVAQLTDRYRSGHASSPASSPAITTPTQRAAYLAVRMPATFAASIHVLMKIRRLAPSAALTSVLDLGAGPGTLGNAAAEAFPSLAQVTMVERDRSFIELGRRLNRQSPHSAIRDSRWLQQDLRNEFSCEPHDLVAMSYTLNELSQAEVKRIIAQAWQSVREFMVVIEPGTMRGFGLVHAVRTQLIAEGAHIVAPCPHAGECPMAAAGDWCHFAQRIERTSIHRRLKSGTLGHEDEKFSYVVASRSLFKPAEARIVRHPQKRSGHVQLLLCTPNGLEKRTVSKSQENYKLARKAEWGEGWG